MQTFDAIVVGGGPGGSTSASKLIEAGLSVAVLDRERFPRTKLCAGWVTPEAVEMLKLDPETYPHRFNTFDHLVVHVKGLTFKLNSPQHSIRRYEFDDYLLKTSGADVYVHNVRDVSRENGSYVIDGEFRSRYLIGAGGTRCPVYRSLFRDANPRAKELQIATYEHEFPYDWQDPRCHLWFFANGLPGYSWYVPKANGYLNCGVGGMAEKVNQSEEDIKSHWRHHTQTLDREGLVQNFQYAPKGYSYFVRREVNVVQIDNAYIVGDAVGLATRDLGEGIGPAIHSAQLAAHAIINDTEYSVDAISAFSSDGFRSRWQRSVFKLGRVLLADRQRAAGEYQMGEDTARS